MVGKLTMKDLQVRYNYKGVGNKNRKWSVKEIQDKYNRSIKGLKRAKEFGRTEKGRINMNRKNEKKRNMPKAKIIGMLVPNCELHHLHKDLVTCVPSKIHRAISHICGDGKLEGVIG